MIRTALGILALAAVPLPAMAQPVAVRIVWDGADQLGGILANRVRGLVSNASDKREVVEPVGGLSVLLQTIDPAAEFQKGAERRSQITVYSLVINVRHGDGTPDTFASAALGYCGFDEVAACSREIVATIDEEIAKRGLR